MQLIAIKYKKPLRIQAFYIQKKYIKLRTYIRIFFRRFQIYFLSLIDEDKSKSKSFS